MDVGDLVARLRAAVDQIEHARTMTLLAAATAMDDARTIYGRLLGASTDREAALLATRMSAALEQAAAAWHKCEATERAVTGYITRISTSDVATENQPATTPRPEPPAVLPPPPTLAAPEPPGVENVHGDRYPNAAAPMHEYLPPRVIKGAANAPLVG